MTAFVVVNPTAGDGHIVRDWPKIRPALESLFPQMQVVESHARGEIARLVRAALKDGHLDIIAVGGDGTIHEAVNGFFEHDAPISPDAVFGFVACGHASDFRRTFGIKAGYEAGIAQLKRARIHKLDIGHVSCVSARGEPVSRFFVNAASFGLSGRIVSRLNRARVSRLFGRRFAFALHAGLALLGWRPKRVRLITDGDYDEIAGIADVVLANGRWFGGGLKIAPNAEPGDALFDIAMMGGASRRGMLKTYKILRGGGDPGLRLVRASKLVAAPTVDTHGAVEVEADGESVGLLPATFQILPGAINLRC